MKKIISLGLIFVFALGLVGSVLAIAPEAESEDVGRPVKKVTGLENAESRINRVIERIREMDLGGRVNMKGLENALRNILRNQEKDEKCLEVASGLEFGDAGEEVKVLREVLDELNYDDDFEDEEDDKYGWGVAKAIYDYQVENEIKLNDFKERMGFELNEKTRTKLNEEYECEEEDEEEDDEEDEEEDDEEDEEEKVVEECEKGADCGWVSTNCCPENAGANWECVNKKETDLDCPEDVVCTQVVSPKPTEECSCEDDECEVEEDDEEDSEDDLEESEE